MGSGPNDSVGRGDGEFRGGADEPCRADGKAIFENGILKMSVVGGEQVVCRSPEGIPSDSVASIRLRLKVLAGTAMDVRWSPSDLTAWAVRRWIEMATVQTIPDGRFHTFPSPCDRLMQQALIVAVG